MLELAKELLAFLLTLPSALLGIPSAVLAGVFTLLAINRMVRHEVLLFAHVRRSDDRDSYDLPNKSDGNFVYSFYIQNLEEVPYPKSLHMQLRALECSPSDEIAQVRLFAGPKDFQCALKTKTSDASWEWTGDVSSLGAYDTWLISCLTPAQRVELTLETGYGQSFMSRLLNPDVHPRRIVLGVTNSESSKYEGASKTPSIYLLWMTMFAVAFGYGGAIGIVYDARDKLGLSNFEPGWTDFWWLCGIIAALIFGYRRIQRRVYPIVHGYQFETIAREVVAKDEVAAGAA